MSFLDSIYIWKQTCIQCGSLTTKGYILCFYCAHQFRIHFTATPSQVPPLKKIFSYFYWSKSNNSRVYPLIQEIKNTQSLKQAQRMIDPEYNILEMIEKNHISFRKRSLFWVPIPSHTIPLRNLYFCQALQNIWGGQILNILYFSYPQESPQKKKNRMERHKCQIKSHGNILIDSEDLIILVDDIITTGSTLQAAAKIFTFHVHIYGFTFFSRTFD